MLRVRDGVDVGELSGGLTDGAYVLGRLHFRHQPVLFDEHHVHKGEDAGQQERQLIGHVGAGLVVLHGAADDLQHPAVGEGAGGVQHAVSGGHGQGHEALGVLVVACLLPLDAQLVILPDLHHAQTHGAHTHQRHGEQGQGRVSGDAVKEDGQHGHQGAGGVADGGGDGQLDVPQAHIAHGHGEDVQKRHRQVRQDDVQIDDRTAHKDLVGRVKAHDDAHGHHHFQVAVLVPGIPAADFGKEVGAAPAEQRDQREPKPHIAFSPKSLYSKRYLPSGRVTRPASASFWRLMRMPSLAWYQVRPPWK